MILIDGNELADEIKEKLRIEVSELKQNGIHPKLTVILVGDDFASKKYVNNKKMACEYVGIEQGMIELGVNATEEELIMVIRKLNSDESVHGILIQLPLPKHIDVYKIINIINPNKDVDGFHPENVGKLSIGCEGVIPCTPNGIMKLLEKYDIDVRGKNCVVIGKSDIVGKPISMLLLRESATVTVCHIETRDISNITKQADVLIVATGNPGLITADMIKPGVVIIDVGINRNEYDEVCGDVDFEGCKNKASYITPVPGGVGPMTIAMLMENCVKAARGLENKGEKKYV
ncbi:MAG TPA: bifunctional methylenetetrahydrofolate dehydrogenase/methenyltetrahydrofolate cyclohydrolase [Clostridiales bacterium]|nr:MAG: bifunctional methylenetetrahydrofolate dehydrogenase/methenyltetrahydrofolate cyclohydrolase [Clostridiales bacterium GWD2_32_59]HAN10606.1 bifunctional methylenetetrahydrofolate dehydrogenase/methenyltetrahydrofolate cyclohydrolase [Clostridiales bacterium]